MQHSFEITMGKEMYKWAEDLFPICRSITGQGVRETLTYIQKLLPDLKIHEVKTGTKAFDWEVPNEWNIKDAFIVNIGIDFEIRVLPNYNSNEVLLRCVQALKDYFNIDSWRINEPIYLSQMYSLLDSIKGVQSAVRPDKNNKGGLEVYNKFNGNYSPNKYTIQNATRNGVIHPPKDPSIFEIKFPNSDIEGKVVGDK